MELDPVLKKMQHSGRFHKLQTTSWLFVPAFLLVHLLVATCLPSRFDSLSTVFIVLAELAAISTSLRAVRRDAIGRGFWFLLTGAIFFHSAAMTNDALTEFNGGPMFNHVPALSVMLSMFGGVWLLVTVSLQNDSRVRLVARVIHTALSLTIGALIYVEIFSFLPIAGSANPEDALLITRLFDAMDFFLAIAGTIRFFGSSQAEERSFFRILTTFLWTNALCCAVHNRLLMRHDWNWLDLLIAAPYLLLVPLIATRHAVSARPRSRVFVHAVRSGSPIFLAGTLVIIGILNTRSHFYVGFAATLFAVAGYGTLNILTQTRGLEAEESLRRSKRALEKLVAQDALTCISNRRAFDEALSREMAAASRTQQPVSLLMIDVDRFKDLNDALGHVKGDEYLVLIAAALRVALPRASDFVARYGGEEFTAILPATDGPGALIAAERVREEVEDLRLAHPTAPAGVTTVSIGVSTFDGSPASSPADLIKAADGALYKAKRAGRNLCRIQPMDASADIRSVAANTRA